MFFPMKLPSMPYLWFYIMLVPQIQFFVPMCMALNEFMERLIYSVFRGSLQEVSNQNMDPI